MRLTSLQHVLLTITLSLLFTTCAFPATLTVTNNGGPATITAMYGGKSEASVTTPDWFKIKSNSSTFENGWQKVVLVGDVKSTETPRTGIVEISFTAGTTHKFTITQAGKLDVDIGTGTNISLPFNTDEIEAVWLREPDKPDAVALAKTDNLAKRRGWLFVKTKTGLYSTWLPGQVNVRATKSTH